MIEKNLTLQYIYNPKSKRIAVSLVGMLSDDKDDMLDVYCILLFVDIPERKRRERVITSFEKTSYVEDEVDGCIIRRSNLFLYADDLECFEYNNTEEFCKSLLNMYKLNSLAELGTTLYYHEIFANPFREATDDLIPEDDIQFHSNYEKIAGFIKLDLRCKAVHSFRANKHFPKLMPFLINYVNGLPCDIKQVIINTQKDNLNIKKYQAFPYSKSFIAYVETEDNFKQRYSLELRTSRFGITDLHWYIQETYGGIFPKIYGYGLQYVPNTHKILCDYLNTYITNDIDKRLEIENADVFYVHSGIYSKAIFDALVEDNILTSEDRMIVLGKQSYYRHHLDNVENKISTSEISELKKHKELVKLPKEKLKNYRDNEGKFNYFKNTKTYQAISVQRTKQILMKPNSVVSKINLNVDTNGDIKELNFVYL